MGFFFLPLLAVFAFVLPASASAAATPPTGLYLKGGLVDTKEEGKMVMDYLESLHYPRVSADLCFWFAEFADDERKVQAEWELLWDKTDLGLTVFNGWKDESQRTFLLDLEFHFTQDRYARTKVPECSFRREP